VSKIIVHELESSPLFQEITITDLNLDVTALRPYIYKHNAPGGNIQMQVRDSGNKILASSNTLTESDIGTDAFFYGAVKFDINVSLRKNTNYRLALVSGGGYSFAESDFFGWVNGAFDREIVDRNYTASNVFGLPLVCEIWTNKTVRKAFPDA